MTEDDGIGILMLVEAMGTGLARYVVLKSKDCRKLRIPIRVGKKLGNQLRAIALLLEKRFMTRQQIIGCIMRLLKRR